MIDIRQVRVYDGGLQKKMEDLRMAKLSYRPRGQMSESMLTAAFIILSGGLQDA